MAEEFSTTNDPDAEAVNQRGGRRGPLGMVSAIGVGAVCGLAWAASLRGWMIQVAGGNSSFSWVGTFGQIMLPGVLVGGLLGWAESLRRSGELRGRRRRWLIASPILLAAALAEPRTLQTFITSGLGGGAIGVAIIGLTGGYAFAVRRPWWAVVASGLAATGLTIGLLFVPTVAGPITSPHGAWAATQVTSLMLVLCFACSIPHREARPGCTHAPRREP